MIKCYVHINYLITDEFYAEADVRQGDHLSTTLFGIYINDFSSFINDTKVGGLDKYLTETKCLLFADDIVLIAHSEHELQVLLNIAYLWSRIWDITFNPKKCNVVHHRAKSIYVSNTIVSLGHENVMYTFRFDHRCSG